MEQYNVTGMSCAACSARVEKAVRAVPGVETCSVSLLTNSMGVTGTAAPEQIIAAVEKAGYAAGGRPVERYRDAKVVAAADQFRGVFADFNVLLHGTYDVELAATVGLRG